jgi:hypothetical protein
VPLVIQWNPVIIAYAYLRVGDARDYYDHHDGAFWHVCINDGQHLEIDVSDEPNPFGANWFYYPGIPFAGVDQPTLAQGAGLLLLVNRFSGPIYVYRTTDLLNGFYNQIGTVTAPGQEAYGAHSREGGSQNTYAYVVSARNDGSGFVILRIDGNMHTAQGAVSVATNGLYSIRNGPYTFSETSGDPQDVLLSADTDHLYIVATIQKPGGLCQRVYDVNHLYSVPFAPTVNGSQTFCWPGNDVWEGSVGQDVNGTVYVGANCSGPALPLSMCWATYGGSGALAVPRTSNSYIAGRIGDFTTMATDWRNGGQSMMMAAELVTNGVGATAIQPIP